MANPKGNVQNLKPYQFKPGQSGNPGGRPKGPTIEKRICVMLERKVRDGELEIMFPNPEIIAKLKVFLPEEPTWADVQAAMRLMPNPKGDTLPIDILMDRIDGKPVQKVEVKSKEPQSLDDIPTDVLIGILNGTVDVPEHLLRLVPEEEK